MPLRHLHRDGPAKMLLEGRCGPDRPRCRRSLDSVCPNPGQRTERPTMGARQHPRLERNAVEYLGSLALVRRYLRTSNRPRKPDIVGARRSAFNIGNCRSIGRLTCILPYVVLASPSSSHADERGEVCNIPTHDLARPQRRRFALQTLVSRTCQNPSCRSQLRADPR